MLTRIVKELRDTTASTWVLPDLVWIDSSKIYGETDPGQLTPVSCEHLAPF